MALENMEYLKKEVYIIAPPGPGEEPPQPLPGEDIDISYQDIPCSEVSFSKSLGLEPDRGSVTMAKEDFEELSLRVDMEDVYSSVATAYGGYVTVPSETPIVQEGEAAVPVKGLKVAGSLDLISPYGSIQLGPIFVDKDPIKEIQVSEDRQGYPAPAGPVLAPGMHLPKSTQTVIRVGIVDERI